MVITDLLNRAETYDFLGFFAFVFIAITAFWMLKKRKVLPKWINIVLLIVAILGAIVDGVIIYTKFLS